MLHQIYWIQEISNHLPWETRASQNSDLVNRTVFESYGYRFLCPKILPDLSCHFTKMPSLARSLETFWGVLLNKVRTFWKCQSYL